MNTNFDHDFGGAAAKLIINIYISHVCKSSVSFEYICIFSVV